MTKTCLSLSNGVSSFNGRFSKGIPSGNGKLNYDYDLAHLEGHVNKGTFHGRARMASNSGKVQFIGTMVNGRADGPAWLFPNDPGRDGAVFAFFKEGEILTEQVMHLNPEMTEAVVGKLANGTILEDPRVAKVSKLGEHRCIKVIQLKDTSKDGKGKHRHHRLPIKIRFLY